MKLLKGVCVGSGYFSQFHFEAWNRISGVEILAICDSSEAKAKVASKENGIKSYYSDVELMLEKEQPDFIDIITPPESHFELCQLAIKYNVDVICQKPFGGSLENAERIVNLFKGKENRLMVHENFRFQPWHREIKRLINLDFIGDKIHTLNFRLRTGDGWAKDAYLNRQPYFRTMPKMLIYETGIHFIDTFRYLAGEITGVYAKLKNLNKNIKGEDFAWVHFDFSSGAYGMLDANRFNENTSKNPRLTFGEMLIEGNRGSIRLYGDGKITYQLLGDKEKEHDYNFSDVNFSGDCVYQTQFHFIDSILNKQPFETSGEEYLKNLVVQDAIYASSENNKPVIINKN
jgi:predicted dehydrogenase